MYGTSEHFSDINSASSGALRQECHHGVRRARMQISWNLAQHEPPNVLTHEVLNIAGKRMMKGVMQVSGFEENL